MRKAVVPYRYVSAHDIGAEVHTDEHWHSLTHCSGKLTKEDIETMAATLFKETSGPGYCHLTRADTKRIAAAMAVSIGLEVED